MYAVFFYILVTLTIVKSSIIYSCIFFADISKGEAITLGIFNCVMVWRYAVRRKGGPVISCDCQLTTIGRKERGNLSFSSSLKGMSHSLDRQRGCVTPEWMELCVGILKGTRVVFDSKSMLTTLLECVGPRSKKYVAEKKKPKPMIII